MRVARRAQRMRISGASSAGETTTTARRMPSVAEDVLDELARLASALANEPDHRDVGLREARHHAEQHALAHAAAGEDPEPLAAARRSAAR
jgi:hypothetical protein